MEDGLFDWFDEDNRSTEIENRLHVRSKQSPEEIKTYSTEEFSSDIEKAEFLLRKGQPLQKASVFKALPKLLGESGSNRIVEALIMTVPCCDDLARTEAAAGLTLAAKTVILRQSQADLLLPLIVSMVRTQHDKAREVWLQTFSQIVRAASPEAVAEHCTRACLSIGEFSNSISCRETAAHMLGGIAEVLQNELSPELFNRVLRLAQDPRFEVRKAMCQEFTSVIPAVSEPSLRSQLIEEALQLAQDEVLEVKLEAFSMMAQVLDNFPYDVNISQVLPIIEAEMLQSTDNTSTRSQTARSPQLSFEQRQTLLLRFSSIIGILVSKLEAELSEEPFRSNMIDFVVKLSHNESAEVRCNLAKAFPLLIQTLGQMTFFTQLAGAFVRLVKDRERQVLDSVASVLSEVMRLLGNSATLQSGFLHLLEQPSCLPKLAPQIPEIVKGFNSNDVSRQMSEKLTGYLSSSLNWRVKVSIMRSLQQLTSVFSQAELPRLTETLLRLAKSAIRPVSLTAIALLCHALRVSPRYLRQETFSSLEALAGERDFKLRMLFLDFTQLYGLTHSHILFKEKLFDTVLGMVTDPVVDVRFKLAKAFPELRQHISNNDTDTSARLMEALEVLLIDSSSAVARCAGESSAAFMSRAFWKKIGSDEDERSDKQKLQHEMEQERNERLNDEEEKKRVVEKLAQKAKMDYLTSKSKHVKGQKRPGVKLIPSFDKTKVARRMTTEIGTLKTITPRTMIKSMTLPKLP
jgi:hypothetical protein